MSGTTAVSDAMDITNPRFIPSRAMLTLCTQGYVTFSVDKIIITINANAISVCDVAINITVVTALG